MLVTCFTETASQNESVYSHIDLTLSGNSLLSLSHTCTESVLHMRLSRIGVQVNCLSFQAGMWQSQEQNPNLAPEVSEVQGEVKAPCLAFFSFRFTAPSRKTEGPLLSPAVARAEPSTLSETDICPGPFQPCTKQVACHRAIIFSYLSSGSRRMAQEKE